MLDKDVIKNLNFFEFGMSEMFTNCLNLLIININRAFEGRREDLHLKKPGSLGTATEPQFLWFAMIGRPLIEGNAKLKEIFAARTKFNRALEDVLASVRYNHIMYLDFVSEKHHFDA